MSKLEHVHAVHDAPHLLLKLEQCISRRRLIAPPPRPMPSRTTPPQWPIFRQCDELFRMCAGVSLTSLFSDAMLSDRLCDCDANHCHVMFLSTSIISLHLLVRPLLLGAPLKSVGVDDI